MKSNPPLAWVDFWRSRAGGRFSDFNSELFSRKTAVGVGQGDRKEARFDGLARRGVSVNFSLDDSFDETSVSISIRVSEILDLEFWEWLGRVDASDRNEGSPELIILESFGKVGAGAFLDVVAKDD